MTAIYVIGIILLCIAGIGALRARVTIAYSEDLSLTLRVLFFKIRILPAKEKKAGPHSMSASKAKKIREKAAKKEAKKRKAAAEKQRKKEEKKAQKTDKPKKSMGEILDIVKLITDIVKVFVGRFFKHLRIDVARLKIKVATGDAATTAIAYGALTQALNLLLPLLESVKTLDLPKSKELDVQADFTAEAPEVDIEISFSLRVWHLFHMIFGATGKAIKFVFKKLFHSHEQA